MSFLAVMRGCLQIAEHEGEEGKAVTAPIIRLIWAVSIHGASDVLVTKRTHTIAVPVTYSF